MNHPSKAMLLDCWLHDSDAAGTDAVDEHLMHCDACGQALDDLVALGEGVRAALRAGAVSAVTGSACVQRLAGHGVQLREYRLPHNGSVKCSVAPEDERPVTRLEAPLQGVQRLDALARRSTETGVQHQWQDIPSDAQTGEVLCAWKLAAVRRLRRVQAHTPQLTLLAAGPGGTREIGRCTFHHRPWTGP